MELIKKLAGIGLSAAIFIQGCSGLERKIELYPERNFEHAKARDGISEDGWEYQTMLFSYKEDKEGFWQFAKTTIERGGGDCEDFATSSAFYSGEKYGNNVLVLVGIDLKTRENLGHVVHLLQENGKFGSRGYHGDNVGMKNSLKEVISELQKRRENSFKYHVFYIVNLDELCRDWRTTSENLNNYHRKMFIEKKFKLNLISELK